MDNVDLVFMKLKIEPWMLLRGHWALNRTKVALLGIGSLTLSVIFLCTSWLTGNLSSAYILSPTLIVMYLVTCGLIPWLHYRALVREPNFAGGCEMTAGEAGLHGKNGQMESQSDWSVFTRYLELESLFVLKIGKRGLMVIPKNAFENDGDVARFRELLGRKVGVS